MFILSRLTLGVCFGEPWNKIYISYHFSTVRCNKKLKSVLMDILKKKIPDVMETAGIYQHIFFRMTKAHDNVEMYPDRQLPDVNQFQWILFTLCRNRIVLTYAWITMTQWVMYIGTSITTFDLMNKTGVKYTSTTIWNKNNRKYYWSHKHIYKNKIQTSSWIILVA